MAISLKYFPKSINGSCGRYGKFCNNCKQVVISLSKETPMQGEVRFLYEIKYVFFIKIVLTFKSYDCLL